MAKVSNIKNEKAKPKNFQLQLSSQEKRKTDWMSTFRIGFCAKSPSQTVREGAKTSFWAKFGHCSRLEDTKLIMNGSSPFHHIKLSLLIHGQSGKFIWSTNTKQTMILLFVASRLHSLDICFHHSRDCYAIKNGSALVLNCAGDFSVFCVCGSVFTPSGDARVVRSGAIPQHPTLLDPLQLHQLLHQSELPQAPLWQHRQHQVPLLFTYDELWMQVFFEKLWFELNWIYTRIILYISSKSITFQQS